MPLDLQYSNGKLSVFVVKDRITHEIHGITDTLDNAREHIVRLSRFGFSTNHMIVERYRMIEN